MSDDRWKGLDPRSLRARRETALAAFPLILPRFLPPRHASQISSCTRERLENHDPGDEDRER